MDTGSSPNLVLIIDGEHKVLTNVKGNEITFISNCHPFGSSVVIWRHSFSHVDLVTIDPSLVVFTHRNNNCISINGLDGFPIGSEDFNLRESGSHSQVTVTLK